MSHTLPQRGFYIGLIVLYLYIWLGVSSVPFHGDEADHLANTQDYVVYFVMATPQALRITPPIAIDSPEHRRLLTGTLTDYLTGFWLWQTQTLSLEAWAQAWYYPSDVATNRAMGNVPTADVLNRARMIPTLLTMGSVLVLFRIGKTLRNSVLGITLATLFVLHPLILLNGRRIMQEGALIFFSVVLLWLVLRGRIRWIGVALMMGLALTSKPTAMISIAAAVVVVAYRLWTHAADAPSAAMVVLMIGLAAGVYLMLTPAIWGNPPQMLQTAITMRAEVLRGQTSASPYAHHGIWDRVQAMITIPFSHRLQIHETADFAADVRIARSIAAYQNSLWDGVYIPAVVGWGLMGIGCFAAWRTPRMRPVLLWALVIGIITFAVTPLGWQRYYLLWTVSVLILSGLGVYTILNGLWYRTG